ncbi:hypothetical protein BH11BAC2_BH11BAC2_13230 [soil metagenome]
MLYLRKSNLPGAGKGLFTKQKLTRGDIVCEYEGEIVTWAECVRRANEGHEGYVFFITKNRCVDAYFTPMAMGRYANDAKGVGRVATLRNNAQYEIKSRNGEKKVFIVATRTIHPSEEILVDYGQDYWENLSKTKHLYDKMKLDEKEKRAKAKEAKTKVKSPSKRVKTKKAVKTKAVAKKKK